MADLRLFANTSNLMRFTLKHATTGLGLPGLSSATSGLIISTIADVEATATTYTVAGSTIETITTLGTFATPTATKCRFKEVDATNHKGLYELQFADARFAITNARRLVVSVTGAANLLDADYEIQLVRFDPYNATSLGLTNLDAAITTRLAPTTAGRTLDVTAANKVNGVVLVDTVTTYTGNTPQTGDVYPLADTEIAAIKAKTDQLVFGTANRVNAQVYGLEADTITAAAIAADAIGSAELAASAITEIQAGLSTLDAAGVRTAMGLASANLDSQLDALPTNAELAAALAGADDAVLAAIAALNNLSQANVRTAIGLATANLDTQLAAIAGYIDTEVGAIQSAIAALNNLSSAQAQTAASAALTAYSASTAAQVAAVTSTLAAAIAALNNLSAIQVNAEVVDALATDTYAEPGQGAPGATLSLAAKINYLYAVLRNKKTNDGTDTKLYADDGTTVVMKQLTSESGGTVTKAEWITGA